MAQQASAAQKRVVGESSEDVQGPQQSRQRVYQQPAMQQRGIPQQHSMYQHVPPHTHTGHQALGPAFVLPAPPPLAAQQLSNVYEMVSTVTQQLEVARGDVEAVVRMRARTPQEA